MPTATSSQREQRVLANKLEIRSGTAEGSVGTLVGYAAKFNVLSEDMGYREYIKPGAFKQSLDRGDDVRALAHHSSYQVIGRRSAGTLRIAEDSVGLRVEIDLPDTTHGRDVATSVRRGDITGMSFGFRIDEDNWSTEDKDGDKVYRRELIQVSLDEVSVVAWPAYPQTEITVRSAREVLEDGKRRVAEARKASAPAVQAARQFVDEARAYLAKKPT